MKTPFVTSSKTSLLQRHSNHSKYTVGAKTTQIVFPSQCSLRIPCCTFNFPTALHLSTPSPCGAPSHLFCRKTLDIHLKKYSCRQISVFYHSGITVSLTVQLLSIESTELMVNVILNETTSFRKPLLLRLVSITLHRVTTAVVVCEG